MECSRVRFTVHALRRMFERRIGKDAVLAAIRDGRIIESYPDDRPYPSVLLWNVNATRPLHVVIAGNEATGECIVVTVYVPDPDAWMPDHCTRRT